MDHFGSPSQSTSVITSLGGQTPISSGHSVGPSSVLTGAGPSSILGSASIIGGPSSALGPGSVMMGSTGGPTSILSGISGAGPISMLAGAGPSSVLGGSMLGQHGGPGSMFPGTVHIPVINIQSALGSSPGPRMPSTVLISYAGSETIQVPVCTPASVLIKRAGPRSISGPVCTSSPVPIRHFGPQAGVYSNPCSVLNSQGGPGSMLSYNSERGGPSSVMNVGGNPGSVFQDMNPASVGPGNLAVPMTPLAGDHFQPASNIPMVSTNPPQTPGSQLIDVPSPALQNIVSTVNLGVPLDLKKIALHARNAEYNPKRFAAVIMRIREPRTTALIFSSGKMVCTGAKSEESSRLAARKYARIVQKLGFNAKFTEFKVQNMVGSCDVRFPIQLEGLCLTHTQFSTYEPELFPGLIYRMVKPRVVLLIFVSGKVVITGAKYKKDIDDAFNQIYPILKGFKK